MRVCCEYHVQGVEIHFEGKIKRLEEKLARTERLLEKCKAQRNSLHDEACINKECLKEFDAELERLP